MKSKASTSWMKSGEFLILEHSFTELAENEDWMANNVNKALETNDEAGLKIELHPFGKAAISCRRPCAQGPGGEAGGGRMLVILSKEE